MLTFIVTTNACTYIDVFATLYLTVVLFKGNVTEVLRSSNFSRSVNNIKVQVKENTHIKDVSGSFLCPTYCAGDP